MSRRLPLSGVLALIVSVLPFPLAGGPQGADARVAGIRDLLARRAGAMLDGDREAFLATVAEDRPLFRRRQARLFDGFQRLGLDSYQLTVPHRLWPELTTERERARHASETHVFHVEERYAIAGYDRRPAIEELYLTFVKRKGGWKIVSDSDLEDLALYSGRKLWELGPITATRSKHFLLVSHPDLAKRTRRVLASAERAIRRVDRGWPLPWSRRVVIVTPSTSEELRRLIRASFDLDVFVAFAASGIDRATDWSLVGHRVYLNWPSFRSHPGRVNEDILAHELVHIATREDSGPMIPIFVEEGVAEWVRGDGSSSILRSQVQRAIFDERLPLDHEFVAGSEASILGAYQESSAAIRFAAERFGGAKVARFYDRLGEVRRESGSWRFHIDRVMRETFGVGYRSFERAWARWTESTLG